MVLKILNITEKEQLVTQIDARVPLQIVIFRDEQPGEVIHTESILWSEESKAQSRHGTRTPASQCLLRALLTHSGWCGIQALLLSKSGPVEVSVCPHWADVQRTLCRVCGSWASF